MKFFDLFPAPRFLTLSEAGVSISERAIHFVSLSPKAGGEYEVERSGAINLPEGAVSGGTVNDKAALIHALGKLRREHGFKHISVALPEEKAYLYTTLVDKVLYKDLYDAVAFTVEDNAPVSLPKAVFAFEVLEQAEKAKAAVSVLPLEVVEAYTEAIESAGLVPVSYDTEPQAIARALVERGDARSSLIIHLGERKAGLYLVDEEAVQFSSTLPIDLRSPDAAATLKAEIRKFFIFWNTKTGESAPSKKIERVILSGDGASNEALSSSIMSDVETPYVLANVWTNVFSIDKRLPDMPFGASLAYAASIGSALGASPHTYV